MPRNLTDVADKVSLIVSKVSTVQLDIMDGGFVPAKTWPYRDGDRAFLLKLLAEETGLPHWEEIEYEFDLMVNNPEQLADELVRSGASRIIFHIETLRDPVFTIETLRSTYGSPHDHATGIEIGLAISIPTPLSALEPIISKIDVVQVMGIDPIGVQGATLHKDTLSRIRELRAKYEDLILSVDGGVNLKNAQSLIDAGATRLVSGSAIFDSENPHHSIDQFLSLIN